MKLTQQGILHDKTAIFQERLSFNIGRYDAGVAENPDHMGRVRLLSSRDTLVTLPRPKQV